MLKSMTSGRPWKLILQFSLPVIAGNIFQQFYNVMDSVIVGRLLGVNALAAVGMTTGLTFFSLGMVMGMTSGFGIMLSQSFGAKNDEALRHYTAVSFILSTIIAVLMTVILCAANRPILRLMNTPDEIMDQTAIYIGVIYLGLFVSFMYNMLAALSRALGDSRTPLYFLVISSLLNIVLDIFLIAVAGMGVEGAAVATVIAQAVSAVLCFIYVKKKYSFLQFTRADLKISLRDVQRMMGLGVPMALQFSITAIGVMIVQGFLNQLGPIYIAAFSAAGKIGNIVTQVFPALGVATATFVGQNRGAGRLDRVKEGVWSVQIIVLIASVICALLVYLFGDSATRLFVTESADQVIPAAREYLHISAWFYPFLGTIFVYRNALQGLGYAVVPMLGGVFELIARGVAAFCLAAPLGYTGICLSDPCAWLCALIPLIPMYVHWARTVQTDSADVA